MTGVSPDTRGNDTLTEDILMRFIVFGHPLFNEIYLKLHPMMEQPTSSKWILDLIKSSAAFIVGIIVNLFSGRRLRGASLGRLGRLLVSR